MGRGERGMEWRRMIEIGGNGMGRQGSGNGLGYGRMVWSVGKWFEVCGNGMKC